MFHNAAKRIRRITNGTNRGVILGNRRHKGYGKHLLSDVLILVMGALLVQLSDKPTVGVLDVSHGAYLLSLMPIYTVFLSIPWGW
jgi:hypothetical protein